MGKLPLITLFCNYNSVLLFPFPPFMNSSWLSFTFVAFLLISIINNVCYWYMTTYIPKYINTACSVKKMFLEYVSLIMNDYIKNFLDILGEFIPTKTEIGGP